jgi:arabinose-5-phosphate isomerase
MQLCLSCQGVLVFTGVGKSGFIAQKVSQTLVSTGTRALFLSPTDALHGDIGIVGSKVRHLYLLAFRHNKKVY